MAAEAAVGDEDGPGDGDGLGEEVDDPPHAASATPAVAANATMSFDTGTSYGFVVGPVGNASESSIDRRVERSAGSSVGLNAASRIVKA